MSSCQIAPLKFNNNISPRCPSNSTSGNKSCQNLLSKNPDSLNGRLTVHRNKVEEPHEIIISPDTTQVINTIKRLGVAFSYNSSSSVYATYGLKRHLHSNKVKVKQIEGPAVEVSFTQFTQALKAFPGGEDLVNFLINADPALEQKELRLWLQGWVDKNIPGYTLSWTNEPEGQFYPKYEYFDKVNRKILLIGDHHDILTHLFLYSDPEIRSLTERIAYLFNESYRRSIIQNEIFYDMMPELANYLWLMLQEKTVVKYFDSQKTPRLIILGGFQSKAVVFDAMMGVLGDNIYTDHLLTLSLEGLEHSISYYSKDIDKKREAVEKLDTLMDFLKKQLGITVDAKSNRVIGDLRLAKEIINREFNNSYNKGDLQQTWLNFSEKVLVEDPTEPHLKLMRPQVQRKILTLLVEVFESLM